MDFAQLLNSDLGQQIIDGIGQKTGTSTQETKAVVSEGMPVLLGMLQKNASEKGAAGILDALKDHDGGILDNVKGFLGGADTADGNKILGHILGAKQNDIEKAISQKSGVDLGSVTKILPLLAPIVMGYLGKKNKSSGGMDLGGLLGGLMGGSNSNAGGDILSSVLGGKGGDILGSLTGGGKKSGGIGDMLGGLFGKK